MNKLFDVFDEFGTYLGRVIVELLYGSAGWVSLTLLVFLTIIIGSVTWIILLPPACYYLGRYSWSEIDAKFKIVLVSAGCMLCILICTQVFSAVALLISNVDKPSQAHFTLNGNLSGICFIPVICGYYILLPVLFLVGRSRRLTRSV